ncbi:MAG: serine hydrolase domain-containing protein [Gemmatimonadaceae bacterium]
MSAKWLLALAGTLALPGIAASQGRAESADTTARVVDRVFDAFRNTDGPGCALGVSRGGRVVYEQGYGMANLDNEIAITPASVFHVASITKQFTAMSILLLAQRGRLSLDDEVRTHITELPDFGSKITIRHLLTHTSGLRSAFALAMLAESRDRETDGLLTILTRQRALNFTPGSEYAYLNDGYDLLGRVVERVSGQSLRAFMDSNIFQPLGMTQTFLKDDAAMIVPKRAVGYNRGDAGNWVVAADQWRIGAGGNTGLHTTVRDLLIWEQNFAVVRVGDPALVAAMQMPTVLTGGDTSFYGFGLRIRDRRPPGTGHGGGDPGYSAFAGRYPDHGLAVAVLCNWEDIGAARLFQSVANIYGADVVPTAVSSNATQAPPAVSLSADHMAGKVGVFSDPSSGLVRRVFVRDGKLRGASRVDASIGSELTLLSATRFLVVPPGVTWEFVPATGGRAQELHEFAAGRRQPLVFQQVNASTPSSAELRAFAGEYVSPELATTYTLAARDSVLVIQIGGRAQVVLRPIFTDAFHGSRVGVVKFSRDPHGAVTGFTVNTDSVRGLRFDRVKR